MVRGVFWIVVLVGLAALASAAYIRYELAQPDVSGLSTAQGGEASGTLYGAMLVLNGVTNAVLLALSGALAGFVAGAQGGRVGLISGWAGIGAAMLLLALHAGQDVFPGVTPDGAIQEIRSRLPSLQSLPSLLGLTICFGGAAALLGTQRQLAALAITVIAWGVLAWFLFPSDQVAALADTSVFAIPAAGVGVLALFALRRQTTVAILLAGGAAALLVGLFGVRTVLMTQEIDAILQDTYVVAAHHHFLMGLFGLFTLFAALVAWAQPRLPGWIIPGLAALLVLGQVATFTPQFLLARQGMPRRYIDYPEAFAIWNLISSGGALVMVLATITMLVLIWWRRAR